ncbi:MAG: deoxyribodipyrimidine photolyase [Thermoanaerobaculia bacterium]
MPATPFLRCRGHLERGGAPDPFRLRVERLGGEANPSGEFVLYWAQTARRLRANLALDWAIDQANRLGLPVLVYESIRTDYPGANDRIHRFVLEGVSGNRESADRRGVQYAFFLPRSRGEARGVLLELASRARLVVTDEFPIHFLRDQTSRFAARAGAPVVHVDGNGLLPMRAFEKEHYSARFFRDRAIPMLEELWSRPPELEPRARRKIEIPFDDWSGDPATGAASCEIDHAIPPAALTGGRNAAEERLELFLARGLPGYAGNHGRRSDGSSGLSPWIHFGQIGIHEIAQRVLFSGAPAEDVEAFLEQAVIRRELSFNLCHFNPRYDSLEALPAWATKTLRDHADDLRRPAWSYDDLVAGRTDDPVWNLAQEGLRTFGTIHNYLRMLWGKKVIEWSETPGDAHRTMIQMHEQWALDGRDPNTHAGVLWCFGKHDRPWAPERPIFGTIRWMSSESTRKKVDLEGYEQRVGKAGGRTTGSFVPKRRAITPRRPPS